MDNSKEIAKIILDEYSKLGTWQAVADKYGVKKATVHAFGEKGKVPKDKSIRAKLGIRNNDQRFPVWAIDKDEQEHLLLCRKNYREYNNWRTK